jgi:hypothetical protein
VIAPTLTPSEIAAVRAARKMDIVAYPGGSWIAVDGKSVLFRAGSREAFEPLWNEAVELRTKEESNAV